MSDQAPENRIGRGRARTLRPRNPQAAAQIGIPSVEQKKVEPERIPAPVPKQEPLSVPVPTRSPIPTSPTTKSFTGLSGDYLSNILTASSRNVERKVPEPEPIRVESLHTGPPVARGSKQLSLGTAQFETVSLLVNYVHVNQHRAHPVYQYHVNFVPEIVNENTRMRLIQTKTGGLFRNAFIYDKQATIMSVCLIPNEYAEFNEILFNRKLKISIKKVNQFTIGDSEMIHFLNCQVRTNFQFLPWVQILRNFFDFTKKVSLAEHSIDIMPGVTCTIKDCKRGMLMALDTIHKVIQTSTCLDEINAMARTGNSMRIERELVGTIVITRYNNRTYRICSLDRKASPLQEFEKKDGDKINFIQYYMQNYGIEIKDAKQPLLVATPSSFEKKQKTKKIFLIPELCFITGITQKMKNNFSLRKQLIQKTQLEPIDRVQRYQDFLTEFNSNDQVRSELAKWDLEYDNRLLQITGKRLPAERIVTKHDTLQFDQRVADFTKELRSKPMYKSSDLTNWHLLCTGRDRKVVEDFLNMIFTIAKQFGMKYTAPKMMEVSNESPRSYLQTLQQIGDSSLVFVVLPQAGNKAIYEDTKRYLCCDIGIPSQCVLSKTLLKKNFSIASKILIQMVVKIGAEPYTLDFKAYPEGVMVIGFDVFHDKARNKKSVGAFVASLNDTYSSWFSKINFHTSMEEMSAQFSNNFALALRSYYNRNQFYPSKIVVFRDGVSEGRYKLTIETELRPIEMKVRDIAPDCKVSFICINKRVITRYFNSMDGILSNPISGTVVDTDIVNQDLPQFFLVSQATTQGTVTPASYDIIQENIGWNIQQYQQLAYKLCHMYYNWTGLISVPAPCQYAHKLAYLVGGNFQKQFSAKLSEKLFFL